MGFLDKAKAAAEQAASKAKEGVEDVQAKRELSQAYNELGKTTFELISSGEVSHAGLTTIADKIRSLNDKVAADGAAPDAAANAEPYDSSQPPAMPT